MSIENQAIFYERNVCDYNPNIKSTFAITESLAEGFAEFSELLRTIYRDWRSCETSTVPSERTKIGIMTDDLENYHNLTYTLDCLYAFAAAGSPCAEGERQYLSVSKPAFKSEFKKSAAFPFTMLETYGFYFVYFKNGKETDSYNRCDSFQVFYENGTKLLATMQWIAERLIARGRVKEMPEKVAFMLADYGFILTGAINQSPTQSSILNTLGLARPLWEDLAPALQSKCGLLADSAFNPYVFPNRTVTFKKNKKTVCKFGISVNRLHIRLPLSFEAAKQLILDRKNLPHSINRCIDTFGCINCGKCTSRSNIEMFETVPLCRLPYSNFVTEDSRCLYFDITSKEEADLILDIICKSVW